MSMDLENKVDKLDRYDYFKDEFVIQINELWWTWRIVGELNVLCCTIMLRMNEC